MTRVDVDRGHGGAIFDDGDAPVAVVVKMRKQWVTKHYIIAAKPKQDSARAGTHRSALATAGLPAVEKKHDEWRFLAKLSRIDGLAERVRLKRSWD